MIPLVLAGIGWLAWFLPGEIAVEEWAKRQKFPTPLEIGATLEGIGIDGSRPVWLAIHPRRGVRVDDGRGGRWLLRGDRVVEGTRLPPPVWLPRLEVLTLAGRPAIDRYLQRHSIDVERNELARCGEFDCFVIGGRDSTAQLWIERDAFFVRALQLPGLPRIELGSPRSWPEAAGASFPERIEVFDGPGSQPLATLTVQSVRSGSDAAAPAGAPRDPSAHVER